MNCIMYPIIFRINKNISKRELCDSDIGNKAETTEKSPY